MIASSYIKRNIKSINKSYNQSTVPLQYLLNAKLAIIEAGGWVEMSMDDLVIRAGKKLKVPNNIKHLEKTIVSRTWGFDYDTNFRPMLMKVIGLVSLEKLEKSLDTAKFTKMKAALELLRTARNNVAHTYIKSPGIGSVIASPSATRAYFHDIYEGLIDMEAHMKSLKIL